MVYVNYDYYHCTYGGTTIPREVFDGFAQRAEALLSNMLRTNKGQCDPDKCKWVLCEICDQLYQENGHKGLQRESLDGYDVTYEDGGAEDEILRLVRRHFGDSGMLYRGR